MQRHSNHTILFTGLLLLSFAVGCGDRDRNANAGKPGDPFTPPTVIAVTPPDVIVCPNTPIVSATFSKVMNPATFTTSTFTLSGPDGKNITGKVTYDVTINTATFTPSTGLAPSTKFSAAITTGVADKFGNTLEANFVWTFTTSVNCSIISPTVVFVTPSDGACPETAIVSAAFSKAMDPATINNTIFTLTGPGGAKVNGTVTYDVPTSVATFTPTPLAILATNTAYTATITTGATDTDARKLAQNFTWNFTTSDSCAITRPIVLIVTPPNLSVDACPNTAHVSATFSKPMNSATITNSTFTLAGPGGPLAGATVTYLVPSHVATLTPAASLVASTPYTATITTGVADTFGNNLATDFVWNFTTASAATCAALPAPPTILLKSACNYGILAYSTVTNTGPTIITGGNLGLSPSTSVTGFPPGILTPPAVLHVADPTAVTGKADLTSAFLQTSAVQGAAALPGDISGLTFTPGVYKNSSTVLLSAGNVTLDALGNANAEFIFQIGKTLTTADASQVILAGGAQAKNIFWEIGSSATLGKTSIFNGNILAHIAITLNTGAVLNGRALAQNAAVTLDSNKITVPAGTCQ